MRDGEVPTLRRLGGGEQRSRCTKRGSMKTSRWSGKKPLASISAALGTLALVVMAGFLIGEEQRLANLEGENEKLKQQVRIVLAQKKEADELLEQAEAKLRQGRVEGDQPIDETSVADEKPGTAAVPAEQPPQQLAEGSDASAAGTGESKQSAPAKKAAGAESTRKAAAPKPEARPKSAEAPKASSRAAAFQGAGAWTVVLASVSTSLAEAQAIAGQVRAKGGTAAILKSDDYGSLRNGYWVVYSGSFGSRSGAEARLAELKKKGVSGKGEPYVRLVKP